MAFNPMVTFQKNKRFWMAAILMVCMISFVFCTGMKGGLEEKLPHWFGSRGRAVIELDGRSIGVREMDDLKNQRNLANTFMKQCADRAFKNVAKAFFEESRAEAKGDEEQRKNRLIQLANIRSTLAIRKMKPRYFDSGVKFDDLVEFKLWQAEADRLGIRIEDEHLKFLFQLEFFMSPNFPTLSEEDQFLAQREAQREHREASDAHFKRAVAEEFRVKIAQYAVLTAQPFAYWAGGARREGGGLAPKFINPQMPDQIRAPLTLAQIYEFHKTQRQPFAVSLVPVLIEDFIKEIKEPDSQLLRDFFEANKNVPMDPSSDKTGLEIPPTIKIEYVLADPKSKDYYDPALVNTLLQVTSPWAVNPTGSAFSALATLGGDMQANRLAVWRQYKTQNPGRYVTTPFGIPGNGASSIATFYAGDQPEAAASLVANAFLFPNDAFGALAGYATHGAMTLTKSDELAPKGSPYAGTPLAVVARPKSTPEDKSKKDEFVASEQFIRAVASEQHRRQDPSLYMSLFPPPMPGVQALDLAFGYLTVNPRGVIHEKEAFGDGRELPRLKTEKDEDRDKWWDVSLDGTGMDPRLMIFLFHNFLTVETVEPRFRDMQARRTAEEWAQQNMVILKGELDRAGRDPAQFKRALANRLKEMKLTYGPSDKDKTKYYSRFDIGEAKEFELLKESFVKYYPHINLFEGRDVGGRVLKPTDFEKMFFDSNEPFSATAKFQAMPWPPEVKPNNTRDLMMANPTFQKGIEQEEFDRFKKFVDENDPNRQAPSLQLYRTAERPFLFWRTDEIPGIRPSDYKQIGRDIAEKKTERAKLEKGAQDQETVRKIARLKKEEEDLAYILDRVTVGFKRERARADYALPAAAKLAHAVIDSNNNPGTINDQADAIRKKLRDVEDQLTKETDAKKLAILRADKESLKKELDKKSVVLLPHLSLMHKDQVAGNAFDYGQPPLPKDTIPYPRDNMMEQVLRLYDMQAPIEIAVRKSAESGAKEDEVGKKIDEINKELFEKVKNKKGEPYMYVQILTNKPRTVFYIAAITSPPKEDTSDFRMAMFGAPWPGANRFGGLRDHFLDRAQEITAKAYRAEVIEGLKAAHGYVLKDADYKKSSDDRPGE